MKINTWIKREQEMCRNWLAREKKECEVLGQQGYQIMDDRIIMGENRAIWLPKLYESLSSEANRFAYLYAYSFYDEEKLNYYYVDVGYGNFDCRINLTFYEQNGYAKIQFKEKEEFDYWEYENYRLKKVKNVETMKELLEITLPFYEKVKKAVQKQTPHRLRFVVNEYKINEHYIKKLKKEMKLL